MPFLAGGLLVAASAVLLAWSLPLGRPDNGDFARYSAPWFAGPVGSPPELPQTREEWVRTWRSRSWHRFWAMREGPVLPPFLGTDTARWLWAPGLLLHRGLVDGQTFDLTWIGVGPRLGVLLAVAGLAAAFLRAGSLLQGISTLLAGAPWVLLLTASWATSYFNSFYREAGTFAYGALLLAAIALEPAFRFENWAILFTALGALFVASAPAHGPTSVAVVLALLLAARARTRRTGSGAGRRRTAVLASAVLLVAVTGAASVAANGSDLSGKNAFNAIFLGLLPLSAEPARHLERLGLPPEARALVGHSAFEPESIALLARTPRLRHAQVVEIVYHEPRLLPSAVVKAATLVNVTSVADLSLRAHDAPSAGARPGTNLWGELQSERFPRGTAYWGWIAAAFVGGLWLQVANRRDLASVGGVLTFSSAASAIEVGVKFFGDGTIGALRHLVAANLFLGATVAAALSLPFLLAASRPARTVDADSLAG